MTDIASLSLEIRSDQVEQANLELRALPQAAAAAEGAAKKLSTTTEAAGRSSEEFSRRVRRNIEALAFQAEQMGRSAVDQERFNALKRAGVDAESAAGQAITRNVQLLQMQRQAQQQANEAARQATDAARAAQQQAAESARVAQQRIDTTKKIVADLEFERAQLGRNSTERAQYDAVRRAGVTAASAEGQAIMKTVAALESERAALRQVEAARLSAGKASASSGGLTAQQRLMLGFQINDIGTSLIGGASPFMVAAQQGPQISQIFGGWRNMFAAIPTPALVAGGAALGAGVSVAVLNSIAKMNDELAEQQRRFTSLLGSQTEAANAYRDIARFASDAGLGISAVTEKFVAFAHAGQALGATRQNIMDIVSVAEKLTQLSGASETEGGTAQKALASVLKDSTVNAEDLRAVMSNVPEITGKIAAGLGVSVTQLRLMAAEGELSNKQVFEAMLKQSRDVNAEFAKMPKSIGSMMQSMADDLGQVALRFVNLIPLVNQYRLAIELASRGAKALNEATTPATPQQQLDAATSRINSVDRLRTGNVLLGTNQYARNVLDAQYNVGIQQNSDTFAAIAAQAKAANDKVVNAVALANKLDPLLAGMLELRQQTEAVSRGLNELQSGFAGLDASKAAQETKNLADMLQFLRARSLEARTAYGQALEALDTRQQQNELGLTPGQRSEQARIKLLMDSQKGTTFEAAQGVVRGEQGQMLDDMLVKQSRELDVQTALTQAMRNGKVAADEAAVAMKILGISFEQLGTLTPELQLKLELLAELLSRTAGQVRAQANIEASKPYVAELDGIAAAMRKVEQGAFAMKRAEAEARAAHAEDGTGPLQMQVFDARQALTDAAMLSNLRDEIELTNKLAAAAGNVAEQKRIQLAYDIKRAQEDAGPASAAEIATLKTAKAAADLSLQLKEGTAELQRQNVVLEAQLRLMNEAPLVQAKELALIRATQDAQKSGKTLTADEIDARRRQIDQNETLKHQAEEMKAFAERFSDPFKTAFRSIQQAGTDAWDKIFQGGRLTFDSVADVARTALRRVGAELVNLATIRPLIGFAAQALGGLGILSPAMVSSMGFGGSILGGVATGAASGVAASAVSGGASGSGGLLGGIGTGLGFGSLFSGGSTGGGWFGSIGNWLNSPITPEIEGFGGFTAPGALGGLTPLGAIGGLASMGFGIYNLATAKTPLGALGGGLGLVGGGLGLAAGAGLIGSAFGPIGMGIGLLGGLLGLFGGSAEPPIPPQPSLVLSTGSFNGTASGRFAGTGYGMNGGGSLGLTAQDLGSAVSRLFRTSGVSPIPGQMYGGSIISGVDHVLNGRNWQDRPYTQAGINPPGGDVEWLTYNDSSRNLQQAADILIANVFKANVLRGGVSGASDSLKTAIKTIDPQTQQGAQTVATMVAAYDRLGKVTDTAKDALDKISASFDDLADFADRATLSMKPVNDEIEKQSKRWAQDFIDNMLDPLSVQLRALADEHDSALSSAKYIRDNVAGVYVDMDKIATYYTNKEAALRDQFYQGAVENLQNLIARLSYGDLANASPDTSLTGTRANYLSTLTDAQAGVATAITSLPGVAEAYATSARSYFASGPEYDALVAEIRRNLEVVTSIATGGGTPASGTAQQIGEAALTQNANIERLTEMFTQSMAENAKLREQVSILNLRLGAIASNRL